jgi:tetratricopeptide (TPR) repeat protein
MGLRIMPDTEEKRIMEELMRIRRELEIKTGKTDTEEQKKTNVVEQEKFLKMIKQRKTQKEEIKEKKTETDISKYIRVTNFNGLENINEIIDIAKEKAWKESRSFNYINVLMSSYMILGDIKKAEIELKKGNALESGNVDFLYNSAYLFFIQGKLKETGDIITRILKIENDLDTLYLMSRLLYIEGFREKAVQIINKAVVNDKNPARLYKNIMLMVLISGNKDKQLEILENLIEEDGKNIAARVVLEEMELYSGNMESYINQERMIKKIREEKEIPNMPCIHVNRGIYYRKTGKYREAEEEIESAEKYYPECICAKTERIKLYIKQKRYEEIYSGAVSALKIDAKFIPLLVELLKLCYYLRKDDKIKAIADEILSINKSSKLYIYEKDGKILNFKLNEIKDSIGEILNKYRENMERFEIESENSMEINKLFRNSKLCSSRELFLKTL